MPTLTERPYITVQRQDGSGAWIDVGHILIPKDTLPGGFRYADTYTGPPLAPNLDYRERRGLDPRFFALHPQQHMHTRAPDRQDLHGVFQEALPGRWGEAVMASHQPHYGKSSPAEKLWMLGDRFASGLRFEAGGGGDLERWIEGEEALEALRKQVNRFMSALLNRERPEPFGSTTQRWALTSNGGQTPKAAFRRGGIEYIAKFSTTALGTIETTRVESAMASLSRLAGIETAQTSLVELQEGDAVLLSRRFDVDDDGRRIHKINAATALDMPVAAHLDYLDIVAFIQVHSSDPQADTRELYGRMLLNVFANNTDDHLGQFEFMADGDQWRLAPNFDVLVDELDADGSRRPHALKIAGDAVVPTIDPTWIDYTGEAFGLPAEEAREIAARVATAMEHFEQAMSAAGVPSDTLQRYLLPAVGLETIRELGRNLAAAAAQEAAEHARHSALLM